MTTREELKSMYENKFFYEVVKPKTVNGTIQLFGPHDNILYTNPVKNSEGEEPNPIYKFVQVIDGRVVQAFTENEILVTDRVL